MILGTIIFETAKRKGEIKSTICKTLYHRLNRQRENEIMIDLGGFTSKPMEFLWHQTENAKSLFIWVIILRGN